MKIELTHDWGCIVRRAWSVRFMIGAFVFTTLETALPLLDGFLDVHPGVFAAMSGLCTGAAFVSRLVAQNNLGGPR